jgi:hypothetical protein
VPAEVCDDCGEWVNWGSARRFGEARGGGSSCSAWRLCGSGRFGGGGGGICLARVRVMCRSRLTSGPCHSSARIGPAEGEISLLERVGDGPFHITTDGLTQQLRYNDDLFNGKVQILYRWMRRCYIKI